MAPPESSVGESGDRHLVGGIIAGALWLGGSILFAVSVAPAAFDALPTRELAGAVVGRVLPVIFWSGAGVGCILLALELQGRERRRRIRLIAAAIVAASCLVAQLAIAPRIASLRAELRAPLSSLALDDPQRVAFGRLHMFSVAWLGVAMVGAAVAVGAAAITLDRKDGS